jgi:hypothetical protein
MKGFSVLVLTVALLLMTTHRLPAPISEVPESPTPAPEQSAKPKPKRTSNPKSRVKIQELRQSKQDTVRPPHLSVSPRHFRNDLRGFGPVPLPTTA